MHTDRHKILAVVVASALLICQGSAIAGPTRGLGNFEFIEDTDAIDDSDRSYITAQSNESEDVKLNWECEGDGLNVSIDTDQTFPDEDARVIYRFDKNDAIDSNGWIEAVEGGAVYLPIDDVEDFTSSALKSSELVARTFDYFKKFKTYSFDLNGLDKALAKLSCYEEQE